MSPIRVVMLPTWQSVPGLRVRPGASFASQGWLMMVTVLLAPETKVPTPVRPPFEVSCRRARHVSPTATIPAIRRIARSVPRMPSLSRIFFMLGRCRSCCGCLDCRRRSLHSGCNDANFADSLGDSCDSSRAGYVAGGEQATQVGGNRCKRGCRGRGRTEVRHQRAGYRQVGLRFVNYRANNCSGCRISSFIQGDLSRETDVLQTGIDDRSEEHTSELQSLRHLV